MNSGTTAIVFLFGGLTGMLMMFVANELFETELEPDVAQYREVRDFAKNAFVREVDDEELVKLALDGMLRGLDGYSRYYDVQESIVLQRETEGRFKGIGTIFRNPTSAGLVLYPLTGSPAERAGVRVGDQFLELDGQIVADMGEGEFRALLGDPPRGQLDVLVRGRDGVERSLTLVPESVIDPTVRHGHLIDPERGIGYLAITSFTSQTCGEFDRAFSSLRAQGAKGMILDLRGNYGGVLETAVAIAGRFISDGVIVSTEGRGNPIVHRAEKGEDRFRDTPLIVLVDRDSASASEVLAGALQDHRACVLVGAPTYGKGMVQTIRRFPDYSTRAKVTSSYYYSPSGRHFERSADAGRKHGILPDVLVELSSTEERAHRLFVNSYGPDPERRAEVEKWEEEDGLDLLSELPHDPQVLTALALFAGERPDPERIASR